MGLPTVAMGLLAVTMPPAQAAALLLIPSLVTNLWQLFTGPSFAGLCKRLWTMMAGIVLGTAAGAGVLTGAHAGAASAGLGASLVLYAILGLLKSGKENLDVIIWAKVNGVAVDPVFEILEALDVNSRRLAHRFESRF